MSDKKLAGVISLETTMAVILLIAGGGAAWQSQANDISDLQDVVEIVQQQQQTTAAAVIGTNLTVLENRITLKAQGERIKEMQTDLRMIRNMMMRQMGSHP